MEVGVVTPVNHPQLGQVDVPIEAWQLNGLFLLEEELLRVLDDHALHVDGGSTLLVQALSHLGLVVADVDLAVEHLHLVVALHVLVQLLRHRANLTVLLLALVQTLIHVTVRPHGR